MAAKRKRCEAGHDPSSNCSTCGMHCCTITPERGQEIADLARSGTNWAEVAQRGAACQCGLRNAPVCHRHPKESGS
ncbi:MAG TPA: hypothetical protein VJQ57_13865 [Acidimicrobiia bacterium]|nr:hypothetical protein [Acidimicrobiia bacterium]